MEIARKTELAGLDENERVALVALLGKIVVADRTTSDDERHRLGDVIEGLGPEAYDRAAETVDRSFESDDDVKAFCTTIQRQDAREIIYGTVMDVSMANAVSPQEAPLLDWLASAWNIVTRSPTPNA